MRFEVANNSIFCFYNHYCANLQDADGSSDRLSTVNSWLIMIRLIPLQSLNHFKDAFERRIDHLIARRKGGKRTIGTFSFSFLMRLFMLRRKFRRYASVAKSRA
jgi:hypothetical protein